MLIRRIQAKSISSVLLYGLILGTDEAALPILPFFQAQNFVLACIVFDMILFFMYYY